MAGRGASHEVRLAAAERRRQVAELRSRGLTFEMIGKQLGISRHLAYKHYRRGLTLIPAVAVNEMRKLEGERIADAFRRVYTELAGRPDPKFPNDPTKTIRPNLLQVLRLIDSVLKISHHEALLYGLYTRKHERAWSPPVQPVSDHELDRQLDRLTDDEQSELMRLNRKMQGRGVDLGPEHGYEVKARAAASAALRAAKPEKGAQLDSESSISCGGNERQDQPEVFSHLTSNERTEPVDLIQSTPFRKDAGKPPVDKRAESQTSPATSNGKDHSLSPVATAPASPSATLEFQPCPKCGRYATVDEEPTWVNQIPTWHKNCRSRH